MKLPSLIDLHNQGQVCVGMKFDYVMGYFCTITGIVDEGYECDLSTGEEGIINVRDYPESWTLILSKESYKLLNFRKQMNDL